MPPLSRRIHGFTGTSYLSARTCVSAALAPQMEPERTPGGRSVDELCNERDLRKMVDRFKQLCGRAQFRKNMMIYNETVRRLTAAKKFSWIEEILEDQKQYKCFAVEGFVNRIILLYGKAGMFDHARRLFDEMPKLNCKPTVRSFNVMLEACVKSNAQHKIEEIFREVPPKLSITPDLYSYNIVIKAYLEMGSVDSILAAMEEMQSHGIKPVSITYGLLLDGLYRTGRVSEADNVWDSLESKGIAPCMRCYNAKVRFLVAQKRISEAVELVEGLETEGLKPDVFTFYALFKGFQEEKNFEEAKKLYHDLPNYNCHAHRLIYGILIPFATEMGEIGFALELCLEAISKWSFVDEATLQGVVDGLVEKSNFEQAKTLVDSVRQYSGFYGCELKLSLDE